MFKTDIDVRGDIAKGKAMAEASEEITPWIKREKFN